MCVCVKGTSLSASTLTGLLDGYGSFGMVLSRLLPLGALWWLPHLLCLSLLMFCSSSIAGSALALASTSGMLMNLHTG